MPDLVDRQVFADLQGDPVVVFQNLRFVGVWRFENSLLTRKSVLIDVSHLSGGIVCKCGLWYLQKSVVYRCVLRYNSNYLRIYRADRLLDYRLRAISIGHVEGAHRVEAAIVFVRGRVLLGDHCVQGLVRLLHEQIRYLRYLYLNGRYELLTLNLLLKLLLLGN